MVVQNKAYDVTLRVFCIKFLQELYKVGAFVAVTYQRNCIPGQQVYPCKEGHCPEPLVFAVPLYETFSLLRRQVGGNRCDGLYAGFFVIRDCMYLGGFFILYYELPISVETEGKLLVHDEYIMHLLVEIGIPFLAIVPHPERFDFGFLKDFPGRCL